MKHPFNIGDEVVCIESDEYGALKINQIYTVKDIARFDFLNYVTVESVNGVIRDMYSTRFKLVKKRPILTTHLPEWF